MKKLTIKYFAILRDHAGCATEELATESCTTADLYGELQELYQFPAAGAMKVAVNDEFQNWNYQLDDGDLVVFIPPVAGG
jgi:molybdopterin converting factor small subunit